MGERSVATKCIKISWRHSNSGKFDSPQITAHIFWRFPNVMARTIIGIPTGNYNFLISEIVRTPGLPSRITHLKKHGMTHLIILWQMGNMLLSQPIFQYNFQYFVLVFKTELRVNFPPFQIWFQNNDFTIAENPAKTSVYSAVLRFVLPRFISSKEFRS